MKRLIGVLLFTFLLGTAAQGFGYTVNYFTDRSAWEAAVSSLGIGYALEDFNDGDIDPGPGGLSISSDWPDAGIIQDPNGAAGDLAFEDRVDNDPTLSTTFSFDSYMVAFGGDFDLTYFGEGTGIDPTVTLFFESGGSAALTTIDNTQNGFWGFVLDGELFDQLVLTGDGQGGVQETYILDDLVYASPCCTPVPIPGAVWLLGTGVLGLLGLRKRMKA